MEKKWKHLGTGILWLVLGIVFCLFSGPSQSLADDDTLMELPVVVSFNQTEARSMLKWINDFRSGAYVDGGKSQPWALDSSGNVDTVSYVDLSALQYDYELEMTAMQRAAEIAMLFDHTRPDGSLCFSIFPSDCYNYGENVAIGYSTAEGAFKGLAETYDPYADQGHRRNMLEREFNCVGVGYATVETGSGTLHCWVQDFGWRYGSTSPTEAVDRGGVLYVSVLKSLVEGFRIYSGESDIRMPLGTKKELSDIFLQVKLKTSRYLPLAVSCSASVADPSVATLDDSVLTAKKAGTTKLVLKAEAASFGTITLDIPVTVEAVLKNQPMTVKGKTVKVSFAKLKKKKQTIQIGSAVSIKNAQGKLTYKKKSGNSAITVSGKKGTITVKKGLKKGTYKVKIAITAAGNSDYRKGTKTATVKIRVK